MKTVLERLIEVVDRLEKRITAYQAYVEEYDRKCDEREGEWR